MKKSKLFTPNKLKTSKKFINNKRKTSQDMYNDRDWINYRFRFLHHNPKCYACGSDSNVVDHLLPFKGDISLFESNKNHIPLCSTDHGVVTRKFDESDNPDTVGKLKYLQQRREETGTNVKVKVIPYRK